MPVRSIAAVYAAFCALLHGKHICNLRVAGPAVEKGSLLRFNYVDDIKFFEERFLCCLENSLPP